MDRGDPSCRVAVRRAQFNDFTANRRARTGTEIHDQVLAKFFDHFLRQQVKEIVAVAARDSTAHISSAARRCGLFMSILLCSQGTARLNAGMDAVSNQTAARVIFAAEFPGCAPLSVDQREYNGAVLRALR